MPCGVKGGGDEVRNNYKMKKKNDFIPCGGRNWARGGEGGKIRDCMNNYKIGKELRLY